VKPYPERAVSGRDFARRGGLTARPPGDGFEHDPATSRSPPGSSARARRHPPPPHTSPHHNSLPSPPS